MINKVVLALALSSVGATTTHCNINRCGCPDSDGAYSETWCNEDNSLVKSDWCNTSEERCEGNCNGHWCETGDAEWGYSGDLDEHNWVDLGYPDCAGGTDPDGDGRYLLATQSPIDIRFGADGKTSMEASTAFGGIDSYAFAATGAEFAVTQSHGAPKFSFTSGSGAYLDTTAAGGQRYEFLQMHFHAPSENTLNGVRYPLCVHMVHQAGSGQDVPGQYGVVGIFFEGTVNEDDETPATLLFDQLWAHIADEDGTMTGVDLSAMIDGTSGFANWAGSFTTPPCTEGVKWVQQLKAVAIKPSQVDAFWDHIGGYPGNARSTQDLNERTEAQGNFVYMTCESSGDCAGAEAVSSALAKKGAAWKTA